MTAGPNYREGGFAGRPTACARLHGSLLLHRGGTGSRVEDQPGAYIPHGEGSGRNNPWPEDTLPRPRCLECRDEILYERGAWWHREILMDKLHAAEPETIPQHQDDEVDL